MLKTVEHFRLCFIDIIKNRDSVFSRCFAAEIWKKEVKSDFKTGCTSTIHESCIIPNFSVSQSNYQKTNHTSGLCHYRFMCCDLYEKLTWACCWGRLLFLLFADRIFFIPFLIRKMKSTINSLDKSFFLVNFVKRQHMALGRLICVWKSWKARVRQFIERK